MEVYSDSNGIFQYSDHFCSMIRVYRLGEMMALVPQISGMVYGVKLLKYHSCNTGKYVPPGRVTTHGQTCIVIEVVSITNLLQRGVDTLSPLLP